LRRATKGWRIRSNFSLRRIWFGRGDSMARRGPRSLRWPALAVLAVLLAACAGNPKTAPSSSATSAPSPGASTSSASPPPVTYPHTWTIESVDARGATWTTSVAIADVISGGALSAYTTLYGNPCRLHTTTDAIVPFQITTTGTPYGLLTASGNQELKIVNASLAARRTQSKAGTTAGEVLKTAESSSNGATCSNLDPPGDEITLGNDSLTNGQQVVLKGYFDLKHWAVSGSKRGDSLWIPNIWIFVPSGGANKTGKDWETTSVSGPAVVSLLDYTPTPNYNPAASYDKHNIGYGWVFPIDGRSQPDCGRAASASPSGSVMPSLQSLCIALPEEIVMQYLSNHAEITDAIGRSLTGITSEDTMKAVFSRLRNKGEMEVVPGKSGTTSAWRKKAQ
jgi:hypothetical protein